MLRNRVSLPAPRPDRSKEGRTVRRSTSVCSSCPRRFLRSGSTRGTLRVRLAGMYFQVISGSVCGFLLSRCLRRVVMMQEIDHRIVPCNQEECPEMISGQKNRPKGPKIATVIPACFSCSEWFTDIFQRNGRELSSWHDSSSDLPWRPNRSRRELGQPLSGRSCCCCS